MFHFKSLACLALFKTYSESPHINLRTTAGVLAECIHLAANSQYEKDVAETEMTTLETFNHRGKTCMRLYDQYSKTTIPRIERQGIEGSPPSMNERMNYLDTCLRLAAKK